MANATWPTLLPRPLIENVSYAPAADNVIVTQMDFGAPKRRRRYTAVREKVSFTLQLEAGELQILQDFVAITLKDVLPFDWAEFRLEEGTLADGTSNTATYIFTKRPRYRPVENTAWLVDVELELISSSLSRSLLDTQQVNDTTGEREEKPYTLLLMVAGQSNATRRASKVTTTYDSRLKCFVGGNETVDRTDGLSVTGAMAGSTFASLVAFSEFGQDKESLAPGIAAVYDSVCTQIITFTPAIGARHYRELMPGWGAWANMDNAMRIGRDYAVADGVGRFKTAIIWDHGEADADTTPPGGSGTEGPITQQQYVDVLTAFTTNALRSAKLAQADSTVYAAILGVQPCIVGGSGYRNVQNAHVEAAQTVTGYNLAGPRYAFAYETDGTHITGAGKRLFGEYLAHRLADVEAGRSLPVCITSASRAGAVITLNYNTISGDLAIDTTNVPETTTSFPASKYGFECLKVSDSSSLTISSVTVSGKAVTITLSADPGEAVLVRYAQMTWPGGNQSVSGSTSKLARGNIRDSGSHTALHDGSTLYNWACHQNIEVA